MSTNERLLKILQAPTDLQERIDRLLDGDIPVRPSTTASGPLLLGMSATARFLGVGRSTVWRLCKTGRLTKGEIFPGSFRVRRADLEAIANGRKQWPNESSLG